MLLFTIDFFIRKKYIFYFINKIPPKQQALMLSKCPVDSLTFFIQICYVYKIRLHNIKRVVDSGPSVVDPVPTPQYLSFDSEKIYYFYAGYRS